MSTDEPTKVCCDSIDLRIENGWLTEVHNHCTCGGSGIPSPAHLPGCGLVPLVPLADIIGMAERDRQVAEQAWDEAVRALAWAMANGPDPLTYVREHNPYRADSAAPDEREALARAFAEHHARKVVYAIDYEHADVALTALAARPAPVVSGEAVEQAVADVAAMRDYLLVDEGYEDAEAAVKRLGEFARSLIPVADAPAADDEGGQE